MADRGNDAFETGAEDMVSTETVLADLIDRAKILVSEMKEFRRYLREIKQEHVATEYFRNTVESELASLERLAAGSMSGTTSHRARSSNFPFLEAVWAYAKGSRNLTALHQKKYFSSSAQLYALASKDAGPIPKGRKKELQKDSGTVVHVITDSGLTWMKMSLLTNTRLLFDLAKQGWTGTSDDEYSDDDVSRQDEESDVSLLKMTKELCRAAAQCRVRTRKPAVHLVLPRIKPGENSAIDAVLRQCEAAGAVLSFEVAQKATLPLQEAFQTMVPHPMSTFSETLNIDCTILLAIVSDFSHAKVSKEPWFHPALQRQVEIESDENLMPSLLYPCLGSHKLVCTQEAAVRMREIVDTLGTPSEAARCRILLGDDPTRSQADAVAQMQQWSAYDVPAEWQLPVRIVESNEGDCHAKLTPEVLQASEHLTPINKSVFLYGWATGRTTITSNRTVVKQLESELEKFQDLDRSVWPSFWLCPTSRSLVGKKRRGETRGESETPPILLPDPLQREQWRRHGLDELSRRSGQEVEDLRPNGHPCAEILEAKNASTRHFQCRNLSVTETAEAIAQINIERKVDQRQE